MMKNIKMIVEYDGTNFHGWQYQPDKRSVQGEIEGALRRLIHEEVRIIGAGRTDQGVHALGQVANFHTSTQLTLQQMRRGINSLTNDDVYIKCVEDVESDFHSRFSARAKVYRYQILLEPLPLKIKYNWFTKHRLNVSSMKKIVPYVLGEHDFKNLSVSNGDENTRCIIMNMNLTTDDECIIINLEGNRFLRKMVRGIVGFMHDVGRGRFSPRDIRDVCDGKIKDIFFAPPHGLYLVEVKY